MKISRNDPKDTFQTKFPISYVFFIRHYQVYLYVMFFSHTTPLLCHLQLVRIHIIPGDRPEKCLGDMSRPQRHSRKTEEPDTRGAIFN